MQNRIDLYINRTFMPWYEQLQSIADIEGISLAPKIGQAVESYVRELEGKPYLLANKKFWDSIIDDLSKEELLEYNTLLSSLNGKIMKKLCQK